MKTVFMQQRMISSASNAFNVWAAPQMSSEKSDIWLFIFRDEPFAFQKLDF